eukprot:827371-Amphidinium_carterae.1
MRLRLEREKPPAPALVLVRAGFRAWLSPSGAMQSKAHMSRSCSVLQRSIFCREDTAANSQKQKKAPNLNFFRLRPEDSL